MKKLAFLILAATMIFALCSCGGGTAPVKDVVQQETIGDTSREKEEKDSVGFRGTISNDFFNISISNAMWVDVIESPLESIVPQKEGSKLLFVAFSAQNKTKETYNLGSFNAYVDKQAVLPVSVVGEIYNAMPFVGAVAGETTMTAYCVWELPENWSEFQLNYFDATGPECQQYFLIYKEDVVS